MGKFAAIKGPDVIHSDKFAKPEDFNVGAFAKKIANHAGAMIKVSGLQQMHDIMNNKKGKGKKWDRCELWMGLCNGDLVITGKAKNGEQDTVVIKKDFEGFMADRDDARVINADPGDRTIDSSSATMGRAKNVDVDQLKTADLSTVKGDVIILAHGGSRGSSPGKVYCNNFGNKSAAEIVRYLVKTKPLPKEYRGTVYLDGCFTAAGPSGGTTAGDLNNFAGKVYKGLTQCGYQYLQVKGNLGEAKTLFGGDENVVDAQAAEAMKKELSDAAGILNTARQKFDLAMSISEEKRKIYNELRRLRPGLVDKIAETTDPAAKAKLEAQLTAVDTKSEEARLAMSKATAVTNEMFEKKNAVVKHLESKGVSDKRIKNLVGTFGPEKLPGSQDAA
ncbi:MAG: hypothetical protein AAF557_09625 [Pseudomonadota bacterium]